MSHPSLTNSFAAIDLGSNSFHMVIAEPEGSSIRVIDKLRVPVRLGAGLDKDKNINQETQLLALDVLGQFAQRLRGVPLKQVRIVGTNTLRRARNSKDVMDEAHTILGKTHRYNIRPRRGSIDLLSRISRSPRFRHPTTRY